MTGRGNYIAGIWKPGTGQLFVSQDPATGLNNWEGVGASSEDVDEAVKAARSAFPNWSRLSLEKRSEYLRAYASKVLESKATLAETICLETGKPKWEALQEVDTMVAKVANSLEAYTERCAETQSFQAGITAVKRFRPHGTVAVLGPFNLPGHLPHSHIVPALLAGNTVVFKPSELTPGVGEAVLGLWQAANLPDGVLNLVQGGRDTGIALASHPDLDGLFFTGSHAGGLALSRQFSTTPGKILALELGGNNPLIIWDCLEAAGAALLTVQSAFITSGQRCVCARRLILPIGKDGDRHLEALLAMIPRLRIGAYTTTPEPFLGPVISSQAADRLIIAQAGLEKLGGKIMVPMRRLDHAFVTPGIVDMTKASGRMDEEYFGPLLQVMRVADFEAAIEEANHTRFGLAAGLISDRVDLWQSFRERIRAGVVNWNRPTTGASGKLPFGGIGESGNHRPSAAYAADYCAYPVASLEAAAVLKFDQLDNLDKQDKLSGPARSQIPIGIDP